MIPRSLQRLLRRLGALRRPGQALTYFKRWCDASDRLRATTGAEVATGRRDPAWRVCWFNRNADRLLRLSRGDSPWRD